MSSLAPMTVAAGAVCWGACRAAREPVNWVHSFTRQGGITPQHIGYLIAYLCYCETCLCSCPDLLLWDIQNRCTIPTKIFSIN